MEKKYDSLINEGIITGLENVAKQMIGLNYSFDEISIVTGLSIERIEAL